MAIKSQGDWIQDRYRVLNAFPFVIGVLYYTEVPVAAKVAGQPQTRFIHALELQKFGFDDALFDPSELAARENEVFYPLHNSFVEDGVLFQVYDRFVGYLLSHYIKKHASLALSEALLYSKQVVMHLLQLYASEQFAIVHPQNLIVGTDRNVRFLYGGPARLLPKGTMLPPEKRAEMLYDVYSLGALIYQMVTGNSPMQGGLKIPSLSEYVADCPAELDELVMRSLSFDMNRRPTIEEFQESLDRLRGEA